MQTLFNKLCFKAILHRKAQDYAAQRSNSVFGMDARKKYSSERFGRGFGTFTRRGKPKIAGKHGFHRKRLYKTVQPLRVIRRLCYGNNRKTVCILRFSLLRRFHSGNKTEAKSGKTNVKRSKIGTKIAICRKFCRIFFLIWCNFREKLYAELNQQIQKKYAKLLHTPYILHADDPGEKDGITCLSVYMTKLLRLRDFRFGR